MKIFFYTQAFAPSVGGQETIVMLQARGLALATPSALAGPVELTLVTPTLADGMDDSTLPFRVVRQPTRAELFHLIREADVLHLAGPVLLPMVLGLLLRKPVFVEHHGFQTICPNGQLLWEPDQSPCPGHFMARRYDKCVQCNAAQGRLQSGKMWLLTFVRRWVCQRVSVNILPTVWLGTLLQLNRMETIVHGLAPLEPTPTSSAPSIPTFAFLGRLVSTKGVHVLLEAARILKSKGLIFQVRIIGQGPERDVLERKARDLRIDDVVKFLGYVPSEDLEQALANTTAVVMPSLAGEVFGMVAAQNMQRGRLVIVSDIGSLAEVVGSAGLRFPPGDASALARCMESVSANPRLREELGRKASERVVEFFSSERMITEHLRAYEEPCKASRS